MLQFYICPLVQHRTPWGTVSLFGKVFTHRAHGERYTLHRGLGELVLCSLESPSIETAANIAGDQECIEWPERDALWTTQVGPSRRRILSEVLSAHGVPLAWVDVGTTAGDVLRVTLQLGLLRQQGQLAPIAARAASPSAELDLYHEVQAQAQARARRLPVVVQVVRL